MYLWNNNNRRKGREIKEERKEGGRGASSTNKNKNKMSTPVLNNGMFLRDNNYTASSHVDSYHLMNLWKLWKVP